MVLQIKWAQLEPRQTFSFHSLGQIQKESLSF